MLLILFVNNDTVTTDQKTAVLNKVNAPLSSLYYSYITADVTLFI